VTRARLLVLPGDGIGPEVMDEALEVMERAGSLHGWDLDAEHDLIHGAAWDSHGVFCRDQTVETAKQADAVLVGAVGGPKWDHLLPDAPAVERDGLMRLRSELDVFAGLRPARSYGSLLDQTPYRPEVVRGADVLVLREMTGGVMFARPRGVERSDGRRRGFDTTSYTADEIARHARVGFALARTRRRQVTSVDKANVMESGVLWREVVSEVAGENPDVELTHMYADNCSYQLAINPTQFDVIVTDNLFGDILSDQAGALAGSLAMLPSASLPGLAEQGEPSGPGIYEPVHGSAPDIAGLGVANPIGMILSVAMMFEYGLADVAAAQTIRNAVEKTLDAGVRTPDIGGSSSTTEMSRAVLANLR
jgi:3-isopropylmalate dehydrogenase